MKCIINILFIIFLCINAVFAEGDFSTLRGFVTDEATGEALIGVNVFFKDTYIGCSTNNSGYYVIPKIQPGRYELIISMLGYDIFSKTLNIKTGENLQINAVLSESALLGETVIVSADSVPTVEKMYRKSISKIEINPMQLKRVPQIAEADLMRTLVTLPGILPLSDYSSALYIRGGTPDQNLIMLDGTDVYNPEHAFGLFSTFNTDAIKHVDVHKGGYGAEYGGRLSSVLDITNLDGNRERFENTTSISLLSAKTTIQMPVGKIGSISGSIRRTYFDQTVGKMMDDIPEYYYWDGNIKAFFELDDSNRLTISTYGGNDVLDLTFNNESTESSGFHYDWGNQTSSVRWTHIFSPKLFSNFWLTGSRFSSDFEMPMFYVSEKNELQDLTMKGNLEYYLSSHFSTKFGFEQKFLQNKYDQYVKNQGAIKILMEPTHTVGYAKVIWTPNPIWNIETGLRYNHFRSDKNFNNVAPRFSLKYRLSEKAMIKAATGKYYQYLHRMPRFLFSDIWTVANQYRDVSKSNHFILGYQHEIMQDVELEIETFYKEYNNLFSINNNMGAYVEPAYYDENGYPVYDESTRGVFNRGDGNSWGVELLLRKNFGSISGWIGYSYAKTEYTVDNINKGRPFAPRHDRSSTLNIVANYSRRMWGGNMIFGSNFVYSTGQPYTEPGSQYVIARSPYSPGRDVEFAPTLINNVRLPYYARLDLSMTWQKQFTTWMLEPFLQVYNVGNRRNVWFVNYDYDNGKPDFEEIYMLPILPTLGMNVHF